MAIILDLGGKITSTSDIFYHWRTQARWTRSKYLSHWGNYYRLLHQASSRKTVRHVPQGHYEPQGLSKMLGCRSVSGYNTYLFYYQQFLFGLWLFGRIFCSSSSKRVILSILCFYENIIYLSLFFNTCIHIDDRNIVWRIQ